MPGGVANADLELEERRTEVARLYVQGLTQHEICKRFGVSQPTISHDLKRIREAWRNSAIRDFDALRDEQLAKVDEAERRAWEVFERSREDAVKTRREVDADGKFGEGYMERVGQAGDLRALDTVLKCIERRCKLLGLDAPIKHAETDSKGNDVSAEERQERARQLLLRHGYQANLKASAN